MIEGKGDFRNLLPSPIIHSHFQIASTRDGKKTTTPSAGQKMTFNQFIVNSCIHQFVFLLKVCLYSGVQTFCFK